MGNIQIGSLLLNGQLMLYLLYGGVIWLVLKFRLKDEPQREIIATYAANAYWLWLFLWKGSFVLFHPQQFWKAPLSLLYFDGGQRGIWIASALAAVYLAYRTWKQQLSIQRWLELGLWAMLGGHLAKHLLLLGVGEKPQWLHALQGAFALLFILLLPILRKRGVAEEGDAAVWYLIGSILLLFLDSERTPWLLSLSGQQTGYMVTAGALICWSWTQGKLQKGT